jgi:hypothetical protein
MEASCLTLKHSILRKIIKNEIEGPEKAMQQEVNSLST